MSRIAVSGAAGLVGSVLRAALADDYDVVAFDVDPGATGVDRVDARDGDAVARLVEGCDAVIDLAAVTGLDVPWDLVVSNNIAATRSAIEACVRAGVRRYVFASSNYVFGGYELDEPYASYLASADPDDGSAVPLLSPALPVRPNSPYAVGKCFGEATAVYYRDFHGLSPVCLRIGTANAEDRPTKPHHRSKWLSHRDLVAIVRAAVVAPADRITSAVYFATSANTHALWDTSGLGAELGAVTVDDADLLWRERPEQG